MDRLRASECPPFFAPLGHLSMAGYAVALILYYNNIRREWCLDELKLWVYGQLIIHFWLGFVSIYHLFERTIAPFRRHQGKLVSLVLKMWWGLFGAFLSYDSWSCAFLDPLLYWSVGAGSLVMGVLIVVEWNRMGARPPAPPPPPARRPARSAPAPVLFSSFCRTEPGKLEACSICLEPFKPNELVSALECGHLYHSACIGEWFQNTQYCPLCRSPV